MRGSKRDLPVAVDDGPVVIRQIDWSDLTVSLEQFPAGLETAPIFKGLPDDRCQCEHWGYVISGRVRVLYKDREEPCRPAMCTTCRLATRRSSRSPPRWWNTAHAASISRRWKSRRATWRSRGQANPSGRRDLLFSRISSQSSNGRAAERKGKNLVRYGEPHVPEARSRK
jgi:hypothetical protein